MGSNGGLSVMWKSQRSIRIVIAMLAVALLGVLTILASGWQAARADDGEWRGRVEAMPAHGLVGDWVVRGRQFVVDSETEFDNEHGDLAVGACVEVKSEGNTPAHAIKITLQGGNDCEEEATPTGTITVTP